MTNLLQIQKKFLLVGGVYLDPSLVIELLLLIRFEVA